MDSNHFIHKDEISVDYDDSKSLIGGAQSNFSEYFNLQKIGVHVFSIPPGTSNVQTTCRKSRG